MYKRQSSASVGILQALAVTGQISYGAAIPIIMGQNIGTCITAIISSVGANKNAKRAALVHLSFNVIGTTVWLAVFCAVKAIFNPLPVSYTHLPPANAVSVSHGIYAPSGFIIYPIKSEAALAIPPYIGPHINAGNAVNLSLIHI